MNKFVVKGIFKAILITLSFVLAVGVVSSVAMMVIKNPTDYISLISGGAQLIYLVGVIVVLKIRKVKLTEKCGLVSAKLGGLALAFGAGFSFSVFSNILQETLPIPKSLMGETDDMTKGNVIVFIAAIYIIAPLTEELVFRGLIMTGLRKVMNALLAVFISASLFGLIHLMTGSIITGVHALIGGLIFGLAYEKTGSLFAAMAAHLAGNLGGLIPNLLKGLELPIQSIIAIIAGLVSTALCIILIRKNSGLSHTIKGQEL